MKILSKIIKKILLSNVTSLERAGIQIIPDHFYSPIPSKKELPAKHFDTIFECIGIDWNLEEQKYILHNIFPNYVNEIEPNCALQMMSSIDSCIYYSMIRHYKPKKIVEIGCGESTHYARLACEKNAEKTSCDLICVEPYPSPELEKECKYNNCKLIKEKIQNIPIKDILDCDLLFIDSTHIVKSGSDVIWEIFEIIPSLKKGCLIHFHDIFIPKEYPEEWINKRIFFNEQYILAAFLMFNQQYKIIWASHFMGLTNKEELNDIFGKHASHIYPLSSLWFKRMV